MKYKTTVMPSRTSSMQFCRGLVSKNEFQRFFLTLFSSFGFITALLMLLPVAIIPITAEATTASIHVEAIRNEYIDLEKNIWPSLDKTGLSKAGKFRKILESHRNFVNNTMQATFVKGRYDILKHSQWPWLEGDLLQIDSAFSLFKNFMNEIENTNEINEHAILDIADSILRNDSTFSVLKISENIELVMANQMFYNRSKIEATHHICQIQQSAQQFVYSLHADIALTELKAYTMIVFSAMVRRVNGQRNFTQEAELMRSDYEKRTERTLKIMHQVLSSADRIVWSCDPIQYIKGTTYEEVTRLLQGYIENEVDLNNDDTCRESCDYYKESKSEGCFQHRYCAQQPRCNGKIYNCEFIDSDLRVCQSPQQSSRRYEYITLNDGRVLGKRVPCLNGNSKVESWRRYIFWQCSYCFCLCDEVGRKSDRYFNLRKTLSDVKNNRVVTGLRFVKVNRVFHIQIQEGELIPRGRINPSSLSWKPVDNYNIFDRDVSNKTDYHTLSYESRAIDLDDIHTEDDNYVVTGVGFRIVGKHLNLEALYNEFNFESGKLVNPEENFSWRSNDNTDVSGERRQKISVSNTDASNRSKLKAIPNSRHNQYIDFVNTDINKDAAQSTVPFIDIQDVVSDPPVPLSGIGIYHKGQPHYGGFIALKLMTYDFSSHFK